MGEPGEETRQQALGAFAHELRTPLTSLRMVIEVARQDGNGETLVLDADLRGMLEESLDDLQRLADGLQEMSRLERGKLTVGEGPAELDAAWRLALTILPGHLGVRSGSVPAIRGPWDLQRLGRALADLIEAADRGGDGSGHVRADFAQENGVLIVELVSGSEGGEEREVAADVGFGYFHALGIVRALGGDVKAQRQAGYLRLRIDLPTV